MADKTGPERGAYKITGVKETPRRRVQPVQVDGTNQRSDNDAHEGSFVYLLHGEHAGQPATFDKVLERGDDGYPSRVLVRFRDHNYHTALSDENYSNVRPARPYKGGR